MPTSMARCRIASLRTQAVGEQVVLVVRTAQPAVGLQLGQRTLEITGAVEGDTERLADDRRAGREVLGPREVARAVAWSSSSDAAVPSERASLTSRARSRSLTSRSISLRTADGKLDLRILGERRDGQGLP
jgi:hypothetical protein